MPDIGFKLTEPIKQYTNGDITKSEFKLNVKRIEKATDGANWWTVSTAIVGIVDKSYYVEVAEPLCEMYEYEDLVRVFSKEILDQATN